ncbi:DEAD/DEAH box helicase [Paenibacillus nasutitermitis]|uniref:DEAD/DEAH box helicase n=1 Tax=Paenibacillus nasutitermitis TaxID=1652958 RepID=UPI001E37C7C6|nr:DEAD/DEAH box helicase [Paenibacillus nasutitermitis]
MPVFCSTCGGQRPYGDFVQISYKADVEGYYREVQQRANGVRISDWRSIKDHVEMFQNRHAGLYCSHDGSSVIEGMLMPEEAELLMDRRLPVQQDFDSGRLVEDLLELGQRIRSDVHTHEIDEQQGAYAEHIPLSSWLMLKLQTMGIEQLYEHQGEAIQSIRQGRNVVICTKTASGKSLAYNIPIMEKLAADPDACTLYLAPYKALVEDQFAHLQKWADPSGEQGNSVSMNGFSRFLVNGQEVSAGVLHGQRNVPEHMRKDQASSLVYSEGRYWLTNVHYLHLILQSTISPTGKGPNLLRYLRNLRYIVIDELHQFSGLLGSKVSLVLRRMRMLCERLGNKNLQFIACSATIANPKYLAEELTGKRGIQGFHEIVGAHAPVKRKDILMWNPGYAEDEQKKRATVSDLYEILRTLYKDGRWPRSIIFSRNRQQAQLLSRELNIIIRNHLQDHSGAELDERQELFLPYHAYLTQETKEMTIRKLEQGEILGVVTTSALEVGIDVKCLDVCILLGYPGSQASFWQQAGRVGRSRDGVVIMMVQEEPLQQYFARNPGEFFELPPESATINTNNPRLLKEHLIYAAHEQGGTVTNAINYVRSSTLRKVVADTSDQWQQIEGKLLYQGDPPRYQTLVTMGDTYTVITKNGWNEEILFQSVDGRSLIRDFHVEAVFLGSDNRTFYKVKWVNNKQRKVLVEPVRADYHTRGIVRDSIEVHDIYNPLKSGDEIKANLGNIIVKRSTFGYKKIYNHGAMPQETVQLTNTYPVTFQTEAFWLMWDQEGKNVIRGLLKEVHEREPIAHEELIEGSLHAIEHAIASAIPAIVKCNMADFQHTSFYSGSAVFGMPGLFFYDSQAGGGSGIVEVIAEKFGVLLEKARQIMSSCGCSDGCPSCIQLFHCERQNEPLHKSGGLVVLEYLQGFYN